MAEESNENENKTEEPTQKRLEEALKRGDVVKSQEVNTWFVIAGGALVLMAFSSTMGKDLSATMRGLIANAHDISVDGPALPRLFQKIGGEMLAAVAIPFLVLMLAALGGNIIQHRLIWTYETLAPKLSRISPAAGLKRIFSKQSVANLGKGLIKLILIGGVLTVLMWPERQRLEALTRSDVSSLLRTVPVLDAQAAGVCRRHARDRGRCRLPFPIPAMARAAENVAPGIKRRIQTDGR